MTNYFLTEIKEKNSLYSEADAFKVFCNSSLCLLSGFFTSRVLCVLYRST